MRYFAMLAIILYLTVPFSAYTNPFTGSGRSGSADLDNQPGTAAGAIDEVIAITRGQPLFPRLNEALRTQQRALNARIAQLLRGSAPHAAGGEAGSTAGILLIGIVAFLYGMVHAALPGHRKVLLVSYFAATDAPVRHAVTAGISIAALHSGAAAAVIVGAYYVLQRSLSVALERATVYTQAVTAVIVLLIGSIILFSRIREALRLRQPGGCGHGHAGSVHDAEMRAVGRLKQRIGLLPAIVLSALVPCPGSAMILLFSLSLGVVWLGIYATLVFSAGMAVTLTAISVAAVLTKRAVSGALDGPLGEALHLGIEGLGGLAMITFGTIALLPLL
ncbi:MAG: hypothetical protein EA384_09050 [Spirochaetaceae bacterium]|nr:MAG: hypothetical protein EA384_09050 [Spirochaetaceae bacterium]